MRVKVILMLLFVCLILLRNGPSFAESGSKGSYTIINTEITLQELKDILGLDIYKYNVKLPSSSEITISLRDLLNKRDIFRYSPEVKHNENTILITFKRENDKVGSALMSNDEKINYAVNWNFESVYSGTMSNFLKNHQSKYFETKTFDQALQTKGKTILIDFFASKNDKELHVGQLYIIVK